MRDSKNETGVDGQTHAPIFGEQETDPHIAPGQSGHDFSLVKIVSDWNRRDQGIPKWWRDHLMGMFR